MSSAQSPSLRHRLWRRARSEGAGSLSDTELLALLLFSSHPRTDVLQMASRLLQEAGGLAQALTDESAGARTAGATAAAHLAVVREVSLRIARTAAAARPVISSSP